MRGWLPWLALAGLFFAACEKDEEETGETDVPVDTGPEEIELASFEVTGWIEDGDGNPVQDATVLVGGRLDTLVYTEADGSFSLWYTETGYGVAAIVANKEGYRATGKEYFKPDKPFTLVLRELKGPDNEDYIYQDPGDGKDHLKEDCTHCHTSFVVEFLASKHAESARNPMLQDLYAGVSRAYEDQESCEDAGGRWGQGLEPGTQESIDQCYWGGGVLSELNPTCGDVDQLPCDDADLAEADRPVSFGACADCHAPGIDGVAGGRDLHDAVGLAYDIGVHCDTCHKVRDIDMSQPPGVGQRLVMGRPSEPGLNTFLWDPVIYGPLVDVPNPEMSASQQLKFNESVFCAGCHEQQQEALIPGDTLDADRWPEGLPVHSTYSEWEAGPYNQEATQCQWCHMPANVEMTNSVDIATLDNQSITFGFPREPEDIRRHTFRSPFEGTPRLIDTSLYVSVKIEREASDVVATVSVANIGCGHAIPTGEPMRSLLLLVDGSGDGDCGPLQATGGMTVPDTGGAWIRGVEGDGVSTTGTTLTWAEAASMAEPGQVVRVVTPTGQYDDYNGVGLFADEALTAEEKGMEIFAPVGEAGVLSIAGDQLQLSEALSVQPGDILYLGDGGGEAFDGQDAQHWAGRSGYAFSKVLLDGDGERHVPHYRAVDIASDNRISPGTYALTTHRFSVPEGCDSGDVRATVLYRPVPLALALPRGWESIDSVIATGSGDW